MELPDEAYELIRKAERRGYLRIDEENDRVSYNAGRRYSAWSDLEEHARAWTYSFLILQ